MGGTQPCAKLRERLLVDEFVLSIAVFPSLRERAHMNGEEDEAKFVAELYNTTAQTRSYC